MEPKSNHEKKMCAATASRSGIRCRRKPPAGDDYCATHRKANEQKTLTAEAETPEQKTQLVSHELKKHVPKGNGLCKKIEKMSSDPELLSQIRMGVAAIKTLLDEHLQQLDEVRMSDAEGASEEYTAALESHGKRIQSLAGELFEAIDRISRVEERQRKLMTPDEIKALIANIRERVIRAAEESKSGEPPEALAQRLKEAFENIEVAERK
jgi:hypothetical protein